MGFEFNLGPSNYLINPGIACKLNDLQNNPQNEHKVDAFVATLMPYFFGVDRGYGYNPQSEIIDDEYFGRGRIDFLVDYQNIPVLMIEDKAISKSSDSWLDLLEQARFYAKNNKEYEVVFVMALKGTRMAFFMYDQDWHSDRGFDLKYEGSQDMLGLEVTPLGIKGVPQFNTYYPQLKIYDASLTAPKSHTLAISTILSYISNFKKMGSMGDALNVPSNDGPNVLLSRSMFQVGLNHTLQLDPFGRFVHS